MPIIGMNHPFRVMMSVLEKVIFYSPGPAGLEAQSSLGALDEFGPFLTLCDGAVVGLERPSVV
jgi:hypothetical protein